MTTTSLPEALLVAKEYGLLLSNFLQLDNGRFSARWRDGGQKKRHFPVVESASAIGAIAGSLDKAIQHIEAERGQAPTAPKPSAPAVGPCRSRRGVRLSGLFHVIEDAHAILTLRKGVYRQAKVYHCNGALFAGYGAGFVRLNRSGTSNPDVSLDTLILPEGVEIEHDKLGRVGVSLEKLLAITGPDA